MYYRITSLLILLFTSNALFAENICSDSCEVEITFPSGGSFTANETVTLTFGINGELKLGTSGTINTTVQPDSTDFSSGGTLTLEAGESISFDSGGQIYLGEYGNLDYSDITIISAGTIDIISHSAADIYIFNITGTGISDLYVYGKNIVST